MRPRPLRSMVATAVVLAIGGLGWFYLAPTQIGGSTRYMITHGVSMEPLLHTGDLVLVRPADRYRVGEVVAYNSTLLHTVVLHRIIRRAGSRYVFKGDNNDFIDPTHPSRAQLDGAMWLRIPHGGDVLLWLHRPWVAALLTGGAAMLLLFGTDRRRRRRDRRRHHEGPTGRPLGSPSMMSATPHTPRVTNRQLLALCAAAVACFAALGVLSLSRSTSTTTPVTEPYTQRVSFGYHAHVPPGPVYPGGTVSTGEPVYVQLVRRLTVTAAYRLSTAAAHRLHGTIQLRGTLSNTSGWRRSIRLGAPVPFSGDHARTSAQIDLGALETLASRITSQIGDGGSFTLAVVPRVRLAGTIGGQRVTAVYGPALNLALGTPQLLPGTSALTATGSATASDQQTLVRTSTAGVSSLQRTSATLAGVTVAAARWIALAGLVLFGGLALLAGRRELSAEPDPAERISSRYRHLIVPVAGLTPSPDHPPIEVSSIDALAQLAERSERLILHDRREDVDSYLIDDQGTLFRFSAPRGTRPAATAEEEGTAGANASGDATGVKARGDATSVNGHGDAADLERLAVAEETSAPGAEAEIAAGTETPADAEIERDRRAVAEELEAAAAIADARAAIREARAAISDPAERSAGARGAPGGTPGGTRPLQAARPSSLPISGPVSGTQDVRVSVRTRPESLRRPPAPPPAHWSARTEYRVGFAIGPLALAYLAWWRLRTRRPRDPADETVEHRPPRPRPSRRRSWKTRNLARGR